MPSPIIDREPLFRNVGGELQQYYPVTSTDAVYTPEGKNLTDVLEDISLNGAGGGSVNTTVVILDELPDVSSML